MVQTRTTEGKPTANVSNGYATGHANGHANGHTKNTTDEVVLDLQSEKTDRSRWRLEVGEDSRHVWHYLKTDKEIKDWPQSTADKYFLGLPTVCHRLEPNR